MKKRLQAKHSTGLLLRRAEQRLCREPVPPMAPLQPAAVQRLLHELHVHKIELEMQNEELRASMVEIEAGLAKYTDLFDFAPVGCYSLDEKGVILELNRSGATLLGLERGRIVGQRFQGFIAAGRRRDFEGFLKTVFACDSQQLCESQLQIPNESVTWVDMQGRLARNQANSTRWCRLAVLDVSARKLAEEARIRIEALDAVNRRLKREIVQREAVEATLLKSEQHAQALLRQSEAFQIQLRTMSRRILTAQENQRKDISNELHDEISQLLHGVSFRLSLLTNTPLSETGDIREALFPLQRLVDESASAVYSYARELRPSMIDELGLIPALRCYLADFTNKTGMRIQFSTTNGIESLDSDKRIILYRVAQEALTNVALHAQAKRASVAISKRAKRVCLKISDNGKSFDVARLSAVQSGGGVGLVSMRERVEMVGGRLQIQSSPATGTIVSAEIPV